jgi:hypothetical protein
MQEIHGLMCEKLTGHRFTPWQRMETLENPLLRFEYARCRWCRIGYVRPMPLPVPLDCPSVCER